MPFEVTLDPQLTRVAEDAFVAHNAVLVGDVHVGSESSIWFGVVIRADVEKVRIGTRSSIQDGSVIHADPAFPGVIGDGVIVGHRAIIHGARVGNDVLIGMGATVLNGAVIGDECVVGAGALVPEGMQVPPRSLVRGVPARVIRAVTDEEVARIRAGAAQYVYNGRRYRAAGYARARQERRGR